MLKAVRSRLNYANVIATMAVFVAFGGGAWALTGIPDSSGVYHGCVDPGTGALRVVKTARSCRRAKTVRRGNRHVRIPAEAAITWNQQGRPGPSTGAAGGDLAGNYPNPVIGDGRVSASKLASLGPWIQADLSGLPPSSCGPSSRYQAYGNGYDAPSYRLDAYGVVHLRGAVGCAPNTGSPPGAEFLFKLPAGFRPLTKEIFAAASASDPTTFTGFGDGAVQVDPDGSVRVIGGHQKFYSLAGVEFDTLH